MKQEKEFTKNQIFTIKFLFFLLICAVGVGFFLFLRQPQMDKKTRETTSQVIYQKGKLSIFGDSFTLFPDTDKIGVHGNYIFVTEPRKQKTTIYDVNLHKKTTTVSQLVIDYDGKNVLHNKSGLYTYFNDVDLKTHCASGYIKSPTEILCIVPKATDNLDNKLISINPQSLKKTDVYSSAYTLNYVTVIDDNLFIGGYNLQTKEKVLIVNTRVVQVPNRVTVAYKKMNKIYAASLQDNANHTINSYYQIKNDGSNITVQLEGEDRIVLN